MRSKPAFWNNKGIASTLLLPFSWLYQLIAWVRTIVVTPHKADIPVICVGNADIGGAGKTPVALEIGKYLLGQDVSVAYVSRGYGGAVQGCVRVDPNASGAKEVGDEPLLLSRVAPTFVCKDRVRAINMAQSQGAQLIIMDDGLQNPTIDKDLSFVVVDPVYGLGNGRVLPAGPMREPLECALARSAAAIMMCQSQTVALPANVLAIQARVVPHLPDDLNRQSDKLVAFAGIANPQKFFDSLENLGCNLVETIAYPDHYNYRAADVERLKDKAASHGARLISTEKDVVRMQPRLASDVLILPISLAFDAKEQLYQLLDSLMDANELVRTC